MAEVTDYKEDDNWDLIIRNGDFVLDESTLQHQKDLLVADKGQYKAYPTIGVGIENFIEEDTGYDAFENVVQTEFENDGMRVGKITVKSLEDLTINSEYITNDAENNDSRR